MEKESSPVIGVFTWLAIIGNSLFVLWILYNGINEGFQGTAIEKFSYIALMGLLAVNAMLLLRQRIK
ncbi:MAG: hypothetical protein IPP71_03580 [Bacteroidetes bacterium]|nr:hypothetical protein [Bacteroidota bacterium]